MYGGPLNAGVFGSLANFIGWRTHDVCPSGLGWYAENLWPNLYPRNLHESMKRTRAQRLQSSRH